MKLLRKRNIFCVKCKVFKNRLTVPDYGFILTDRTEKHNGKEKKSILMEPWKRASDGEKKYVEVGRRWSWSLAPTALQAHRLRWEHPLQRRGISNPQTGLPYLIRFLQASRDEVRWYREAYALTLMESEFFPEGGSFFNLQEIPLNFL